VAIATRVVLVTLIVAATLPFTPYQENLAILHESNHPFRSLRDCLQQMNAGAPGQAEGPGIWVEGEIGHVYFYYLRDTGPWTHRDVISAPTVYMNLYAPAHYRPVLLSGTRYAEFKNDVRSAEQDLIERAARKAGMSPSDLATTAHASAIGVVNGSAGDVVLLPGPYAACGTTRVTRLLK